MSVLGWVLFGMQLIGVLSCTLRLLKDDYVRKPSSAGTEFISALILIGLAFWIVTQGV